jgi:hypothetical protein
MTAQRLVSSGHKQLCQLAADTLYSSTVRQYVLPLSSLEPQVALATYNAGCQLAEQQWQHAAPQVAGEVGPMQLLLQVVSVSSSVQGQQLQLQVCVRPELQCAQGQQRTAWSGALLQPCHAELLLWHASTAGVTASSTWSWDAISGHLTVSCAVPAEVLLQLHSVSTNGLKCAVAASAQTACSSTGVLADAQTHVARALAAAAERIAARAHLSNTGSGTGASLWQGVQLQAAVAVSACCSSQAAVQWDAHPQQQQSTAAQRVLQRVQLLTPAMALLHLPPLQAAAQDLLLQLLPSSTPDGGPTVPQVALPVTAAVAQAAAPEAAQTPVKASAAGHATAHGRRSSTWPASGMLDVVPPTPCSGDESNGVIPDSQEDEDEQQQGPHDSRQQLHEWWQTQQQRQQTADTAGQEEMSAPVPGRAGAEGVVWEAGQDSGRGLVLAEYATSAAGGCRQLLLQSETVDLQLLPTVLLRMQCFQLLHGTGRQQQQLVLLGEACPRVTGRAAQAQCCGGDHDCVLGFAALGAQEALVTLRTPDSHGLDRLQQLLLLAVRQLPGVSLAGALQVAPAL